MEAPVSHTVEGQQLWLTAQRAVYWEEEGALIVSDLHFGKTGHFRKAGIAVPQAVYKEDLQRLVNLLHYFKPKHLIVVGDFFHSRPNTELDWFKRWREDFDFLKITLVRGNHDILSDQWYRATNIEVCEGELHLPPFSFCHDIDQCSHKGYVFSGHIHPGVVLHGLGKQSLRFPCFYFAKGYAVLPAFSKFTGAMAMSTAEAADIFAIVQNSLIKM